MDSLALSSSHTGTNRRKYHCVYSAAHVNVLGEETRGQDTNTVEMTKGEKRKEEDKTDICVCRMIST